MARKASGRLVSGFTLIRVGVLPFLGQEALKSILERFFMFSSYASREKKTTSDAKIPDKYVKTLKSTLKWLQCKYLIV